MNPFGLGKSIRHLNRYQEILRAFIRYGFWDVVEKIRVGLLFEISKRLLPRREKKEIAVLGTAMRLRLVLEELGPTFIKLGQMLSLRPDLIPPQYAEEFARLQDEVAPAPFETIRPYIEAEYHEPLETLFDEFDEQALAAASLAQVHRARLKSGEDVAVKILRPNIHRMIETDLEILNDLARLVEKYVPESQLYDLVGIVREFAQTIRKEQDLALEGRNITTFQRFFRGDETVKLPEVFWHLTTSRILVTEFIHGIKISNGQALEEAGIDRQIVANHGARIILKQIFEFGIFHADPHPGNIFVLPGNIIAPVDFGMVGRIDHEMKDSLIGLLAAVVEKDAYRISRILLEVGMIEEQINNRKLQRQLMEYLDRYYGVPLDELNTSQLLNEFMELIRDFRIKLPSDLVMMGKALAISEAVGRQLFPKFNMFDQLIPYARRLFAQRLNPLYRYRQLSRMMDMTFDVLKGLPDDIRSLLFKLRHDKLSIRFHHWGLDHLTREIDRSSNRLAFALIIAALIVGSSLVIQVNKGPFLWGYPALGITGYVLATILGLWLIIAILRSGKL